MKHTVHSETLSNGPKLHIVSAPDSSVVEARLYFRAGFQYFDEVTHHVPHLLEHLLVGNGGEYNTEEKLLRALQDIGANINASTDYRHVTIHLRAPRDTFMSAFTIALDCVFKMRITQDVLDKERSIVLREIHEQYDGLGVQVDAELLSYAFGGLAPANWEDHLGNVQEITLDVIDEAYKKYIVPHNLEAVIAGGVGTKDAYKIKEMLSSLPSGRFGMAIPSRVEPSEEVIMNLDVDMGNRAGISLLFLSPYSSFETVQERVAANFASQLLFDAPSAVLPLRLRQAGLVYSVDTDVVVISNWRAYRVRLLTDPSRAHIAATQIMQKLRLYANGQIPEEEFESVKRYLTSMLPTYCEAAGDLLSWYGTDVENGRPLSSIEDEIEAVSSLTVDDVARAAKSLFLRAQLYGGVTCEDASAWADSLLEMHRIAETGGNEDAITQHFDELTATIEEKRSVPAAKNKTGWTLFSYSVVASFATSLVTSQLPLAGSTTVTISPYDYAMDYNMLWGAFFFLPLFLASIAVLAHTKYEAFRRHVIIVLSFVASAAYIFAVFNYFGDVGVDEQPWYEHVVSILQPIFFFVMSPVVFILWVVGRVRGWQMSRIPQELPKS